MVHDVASLFETIGRCKSGTLVPVSSTCSTMQAEGRSPMICRLSDDWPCDANTEPSEPCLHPAGSPGRVGKPVKRYGIHATPESAVHHRTMSGISVILFPSGDADFCLPRHVTHRCSPIIQRPNRSPSEVDRQYCTSTSVQVSAIDSIKGTVPFLHC